MVNVNEKYDLCNLLRLLLQPLLVAADCDYLGQFAADYASRKPSLVSMGPTSGTLLGLQRGRASNSIAYLKWWIGYRTSRQHNFFYEPVESSSPLGWPAGGGQLGLAAVSLFHSLS
jgi:hypothetical protein